MDAEQQKKKTTKKGWAHADFIFSIDHIFETLKSLSRHLQ